jgi:P-type Mg2+ transporter
MAIVQDKKPAAYWSQEIPVLLEALDTTRDGLAADAAAERLKQWGPNVLKPRRRDSAFIAFLRQLGNPLVLVLIFAAAVSIAAGELIDASIVIVIVLASVTLSFLQEYTASHAVEKLRAQVTIKTTAVRDGKQQVIRSEEVVPGDILLLSAGSLIPADGIVLEANDFFVNQAVLTGETFPAEKTAGTLSPGAGMAERINTVFMGTNVRSGTARVLVVQTGTRTAFGQIADRLTARPAETEFEKGIRGFGYLLTRIILLLVLVVLSINLLLGKPMTDSILFAIALAVGIAPELLPAILNVNLSKGAQTMAKAGVIVRKLSAIENLGSMDILCTDKTGTITEGTVRMHGAFDPLGEPSDDVMRWAYLNAVFQTGISNPLDEAIIAQKHTDTTGMDKLEEIPYDFIRKRLSVVVDADPGAEVKPLLITKGAMDNVLHVCASIKTGDAVVPLDKDGLARIKEQYARWSAQGFRVLGVAVKDVPRQTRYTVDEDEREMAFAGYLLFFDPPKADVAETLGSLSQIGVQVKIITGDNRLVARHVAQAIGLPADAILPADRLQQLSDEALSQVVESTTVFAEVDPNQKERIILALKKRGHVVGFMGDGINDAPALHAADIGISVDTAVDVAKEAADFVLLKQDLAVLIAGIKEGRRTFANTLKYIYTTTSANFGNMLSMAGASLFLPFLPLLAKQILLNNFLSDIPAIGVPGDLVDEDMVAKPHRWNIRMIRNFMITFGLVSSVFDYITFAVLMLIAHATEAQFQTGWFVESLLTELVIALVVRTRKVFFRSRPGRLLLLLTLIIGIIAFAAPYLPAAALLGFTPLPLWLMASLAGLTGLYVLGVEIAKKYFFKRFSL